MTAPFSSRNVRRMEACILLHSLQIRDAIRDFDQWCLNMSFSTSRHNFTFESHLQFVFCLSPAHPLILIHRKHRDETEMKIIIKKIKIKKKRKYAPALLTSTSIVELLLDHCWISVNIMKTFLFLLFYFVLIFRPFSYFSLFYYFFKMNV